MEAGLNSLKIEGRMKSIAYVATVVNAYRMALDAYGRCRAEGKPFTLPDGLLQELNRASHRPYTTGFALGEGDYQAPQSAAYIGEATIGALVLGYDPARGRALVEQRNKFGLGDRLSILSPGDISRSFSIDGIWDMEGSPRNSAPHPREQLEIACAEPLRPGDILRIEPASPGK